MADSVEEAVYTYLTTDATFMASIPRVYWMEADTQTEPYVVFWLVDDAGTKTLTNRPKQGSARIQFDLWEGAGTSNKIRGVRLRGVLRDKVDSLNETIGGFDLVTEGVTEQTIQRESASDPYHFVVDGVITWRS
jgi:hypothetical protein